jgi:Arc/MetJ-type ribon-helix-helix transcriptional regulator
MTIKIKPETERLVLEEIQSGHFQSVDQLIVESVHAWREKHQQTSQANSEQRRKAVEQALAFARDRAISLGGISIKDLIHEGHRM